MPRERVYANLVTAGAGAHYLDADPTRSDDGQTPVPPDARVQLVVELGWSRDGRDVRLAVTGWDHDAGEAVDLGGRWAALDWAAANRLVRVLRAARDQANGAPE